MLKNIQELLKSLLNLPRYTKKIFAIITDIALCIISLWIAFFLRLDKFVGFDGNIVWAALFSIALAIPIFWLTGLYRTLFRYSGKSVIISISFAHLIYTLLYISLVTVISIQGVPRSIGLLQPLVQFFLISGSRLSVRYLIGFNPNKTLIKTLPRALVYGAGSAGRQLVTALENSNEMKVVGFIDDDKILHNQVLLGQNIYNSKDLKEIIHSKNVTHVLLAIPSVNRIKRKEILNKINQHKVIVRTLPSLTDLVEGNVAVSDIRDLEVEDILIRDPVSPSNELLSKNISSKVVLVTGAGGSIGSELCRQILKLNPSKLILIEINEYALYKIHSELEELKGKKIFNIDKKVQIFPLLSSIQNEFRMRKIMEMFKPHTLYHAAAYKHVPLVEENICEGVKNNVIGTLITAKAAIENNISDFVFISSDKAVRPTNVMGASKRLGELCLKSIFDNSKLKTSKLSMVRFGNVLDSSGSVIPKFKKQIRDGGPVTLTHPDVTRFFMTIPEAAQLVIQAGAMAKGSDVFVLDMGEPIKIKDLIKRIINLSGLSLQDENNPNGDIRIKEIGLRPGEKLYEELLIGDNPEPTNHPKIKKAKDSSISWDRLEAELIKLEKFIKENKVEDILKLLQVLVNGYNRSDKIVDEVYKLDVESIEDEKNIHYLK